MSKTPKTNNSKNHFLPPLLPSTSTSPSSNSKVTVISFKRKFIRNNHRSNNTNSNDTMNNHRSSSSSSSNRNENELSSAIMPMNGSIETKNNSDYYAHTTTTNHEMKATSMSITKRSEDTKIKAAWRDYNNDKEGTTSSISTRLYDDNHHQSQHSSIHQRENESSTSKSTSESSWPIPFDDKLAISNDKLPPLPKTHDLIQEQVYHTKNILIRVITWNQQAKQLFKSSSSSSSLPLSSTSSVSTNSSYPLTEPILTRNDNHINTMEPIDEDLTKKLFFSSNSSNNNENDHEPDDDDGFDGVDKNNKRYHIIAIGTQECENSISKSILNPMKEKWEKYCKESLGQDYMYIQGHALQASHLVIFAHKAIVHLISDVQSYAVPTGICNTLGNKGGIGIRLSIGKSSFCFINSHLSAHQDHVDRRTYEFATISNEIANNLGQQNCSSTNDIASENDQLDILSPLGSLTEAISNSEASISSSAFLTDEHQPLTENGSMDSDESDHRSCKFCNCSKGPCSRSLNCSCIKMNQKDRKNPLLEAFDHVIWGGDLNYRINAGRDVVDSLLEDGRHDILVAIDQLRLLLQFEKTFAGFVEGPITFRPTYKYDKGLDVYDTSSKRRVPAWTDRILYKSASRLELLSYFCNQDIRASDHRPVYASFKCQIDIDAMTTNAPIVETTVRSESRSEVCVIS